ncbi:molybdopterin-dependent oxidoreductase [Trichlorobacter ammonificans]|uniref:Molybdopterin oxidoreductase n=1 Tax=Trichlorobacter ammonificans TaxID=2916410 RepID=A0ABM9D6D7_9BACT|nr:molybdopterin-dependent oxidoreductase [Trichlorobacter ammonificans]CAH2029955.1 molybdopterin oxidoreductase [Trichlorobacter ammonificans]
MAPQLRSVCPYDCPDTCGLLVTVENGRAVKVCGDPEHPVTRGLICPKMQQYERTVHSPRRLTTPLRRTGPKGSGQFAPITWEEAILAICNRWRALSAAFGADCILPYSYAGTMGLVQRNSGHPFFHKLGASRLARTICSPAKEAGWKAVMGDTPGLDPSDILESDLVILWGINAAATSIHTLRDAREAKKRGARLVAIDTYRTPTANHVDEAILIRPGSDGALALGMIHVMAAWGLLDRTFIAQQVSGFDELAATILPQCTPEATAAACGIPVEHVERLALVYARARAPFIRLGSGLTRYGNGAMNVRCITCLPAVVGAWQQPGGGLLCSTSTGGAFPLTQVTREDFLPDPPPRIINMNQLGNALTGLAERPIRALYVYHSNPAAITPDQNAVIRGLEREDLFTVVHERFMTDTARYADIVLPATSSLEHSDLYRSYGGYQAQRCAAVISPVGEAHSNWDTFCLLARGMGWDEPFFRQSADDLIDRLLDGENSWRDRETTDRLRAGETVLLTPPSSSRGPWLTPSGTIEIKNPREPEPLPRRLPTHAERDGYPLRLQPAVTPFALNSGFYEQDQLRERQDCMALLMHPADAAGRRLADGAPVVAFNSLGEVSFTLRVTGAVPPGTVVTEGVWWREFIPGERGVNALTSQRLTDRGEGSTLYDVVVEVRAARSDATGCNKYMTERLV